MKNKYSIVCEGRTEERFFLELKTTIFKNKKINQCKQHKRKIINGTINKNCLIKSKNCCKVFYLIDVDKLKYEQINEHKKNIEDNGGILIISKPRIEIILLSIFENNLKNINENDIEKKLTKKLQENKIISNQQKYSKSNNGPLEKIIDFLVKNPKIVDQWLVNINNLKIKENEIVFNNFGDIIEYIKG